MKIILPENISEITLGQYQRYIKLLEREELSNHEFTKRKISIFTGMNYHDLDNVQHKDFKEIDEQIEKALDRDHKFTDRFMLNDVELGFIPNFDSITSAEFVDLSKYGIEIETLHNLMAILFRPVTKKTGKLYDISVYNGTKETAEAMKQTPMHIVNGALVFFYNLQKELLNYIPKYTRAERKKVAQHLTSLQSGDGMQL